MKERKKYIICFFVSWFALLLGFISFLFFLRDVCLSKAIVLAMFFALHSIFRRMYGQNLICKNGGYTYIQAMIFYKQCRRAEIKGKKNEKDEKVLRRIGKLAKYSSEFSKNELVELYENGKESWFAFKGKE